MVIGHTTKRINNKDFNAPVLVLRLFPLCVLININAYLMFKLLRIGSSRGGLKYLQILVSSGYRLLRCGVNAVKFLLKV